MFLETDILVKTYLLIFSPEGVAKELLNVFFLKYSVIEFLCTVQFTNLNFPGW